MTFIKPEEVLIFMDIPQVNGQRVSIDDLKRLRDVGIQTAIWHGTDYDERKVRGFAYIENYLDRMKQGGMKCIIPIWNKTGNNHPRYYYAHNSDGEIVAGILSPWEEEARNFVNNQLALSIALYADEHCLIISPQCRDGEYVMPQEPAFDDAAIDDWNATGHSGLPDITTQETRDWLKASYTQLFMIQQGILIEQPDREIWFMLSHRKARACRPDWDKVPDIGMWTDDWHQIHIGNHPLGWAYGCEWIDAYLASWQTLKPNQINHISYNYFPFGQAYWDKIRYDHDTFGMQEWAGAEYGEGLRAGNGRLAIDHGLRGLFIGPTHPYTGHIGIEDWMLEEIKKQNKLFEQRERIS